MSVFCISWGIIALGITGLYLRRHYKKGDLNANLTLGAKVSLVFGGLALLIYPAVILANVMLAGDSSGLRLIDNIFLIGTTAYPVVYILCAVYAIRYIRKEEGKLGFKWGILPISYLILLGGLFAVIY